MRIDTGYFETQLFTLIAAAQRLLPLCLEQTRRGNKCETTMPCCPRCVACHSIREKFHDNLALGLCLRISVRALRYHTVAKIGERERATSVRGIYVYCRSVERATSAHCARRQISSRPKIDRRANNASLVGQRTLPRARETRFITLSRGTIRR